MDLLVVTEAFAVRGGVQLAPRVVPPKALGKGPAEATLITPDGAQRTVKIALDFAHISGPNPPFALVRVLDVGVDDVPPGTRIEIEV